MANLERKTKSFEERINLAETVDKSPNFQFILKYVNEPTYHFVMCQIRNQKVNPRGRRYTLEEKILALSLYKKSGKGYRLLSKIFTLPSPRVLSTLLQCIPFKAGINHQIFQNLKEKVAKMEKLQDKACIVMFDEMAISPKLTYQRKDDVVIGLEDYGDEKNGFIANHVNVFMIKGIHRQWKQPVAFTFSKGPVKALKLKHLLKSIIMECQNIGLEVVATVCDQGTTNQTAINMLVKETNESFLRKGEENTYFGFLVNGKEVIPLYDVPHLFKGIRNNLLTKDLKFDMDGQSKTAKWSHVEQFYRLDTYDPSLRICTKLTDAHVIREKINKMKVKNCTQVFSYAVGSLMKRIAQWGELYRKLKHNLLHFDFQHTININYLDFSLNLSIAALFCFRY